MKSHPHDSASTLHVFEADYLPNFILYVIVNGQSAVVTKYFNLLHQGIVILRDTADAEFPWVKNLVVHLDGDDTNIAAPNKIVGGTTDPILVCLAIRYEEALREGTIKVGPIPLPSREEAEREIEAYDCGVIQEPDATFKR